MKASSTLRSLLLITGILGTMSDVKASANHSEPESVRLLYGESHGISWTDLADSDRRPPLLTRMYLDVYSVDYHYRRKIIFFTGWGAVWKLPMDEAWGNVQEEQIVGEDAGAATLAVDWEHDRVYWTSPATRTVWRYDLDCGEERGDVIIKDAGNLTRHNNVVVDPYARYLFVATDSGYTLRSDLGGGNLVRLDHGLRLTSLALDTLNRRLYVSGNRDFAPILQSSDYDGRDVAEYELHHGTDWWVRLISISVFSPATGQPRLFWVHHGWRERDTAWRVNVSDGQLSWQKEYTSRGTVLDPETRIWCVRVYHPDVQRRPQHWKREEQPLFTFRDTNATVATSDASSLLSTRKCSRFHTFSYLVLAVIFHRICV